MGLFGIKRSRYQKKRLYHTLVIICVGCLFALVVTLFQPFSSINQWLSDQLFTSEPPSTNIVIGGIDDDTLATYGRWAEWTRSHHVQAIRNLSEAGAKVVGFDLLFTDSSPDDQVLADAMKEADNIVLPVVGTNPLPATGAEIDYEDILSPVKILEEASVNIGHANVVPDRDGTVRDLPLVIADIEGQDYLYRYRY